MMQKPAAALLASLCVLPARAQDAPLDVEAAVAAALAAAARGDQLGVVRLGVQVRVAAPSDVRGHFLVGAACGSLGPGLARDAALHALRRVLALGASAPSLRGFLADGSDPAQTVAEWIARLERGERLLVMPDRAALTRLAESLRARVRQVEGQLAREEARLARARQQCAAHERALRAEQARVRKAGATFVDWQPLVDRLENARREIGVCTRRVDELKVRSAARTAEAEAAEARLAAMR